MLGLDKPGVFGSTGVAFDPVQTYRNLCGSAQD
jgi:hypothetical protein